MSDNQHASFGSSDQTLGQAFLSKGWKWFVIVGILVAIAGMGAISLPIIAGVTITTIVGAIFLFSGLVQAYHTFNIHPWKAKIWYVISALLYVLGGVFILCQPLSGLMTITMLMVLVMIFNGVSRMIFGLGSRALPGSLWIALSGLISVLIGAYFFNMLDDPEFSLSLLGIFAGVSLLIEGVSFAFIGMQMKKVAKSML